MKPTKLFLNIFGMIGKMKKQNTKHTMNGGKLANYILRP